ncbi:IS1595 family transposase [Brevundimonas sp.]|uniref:IS1595 family transposase n=1 Tax=Brevundimonas sp. TaxID=1871086 RepID=UPI003F71FEE5
MIQQFDNLVQLFQAFPTEQAAIDHLTSIRWARGKFCPLCGNADEKRIGTLVGTNTHKCYACRKRFSIKVGTIFQDTKLPLRTWYAAIWMITNHPKGIASTTLARDLGITQKTAWFVLHRLRHAARTDSFNGPLSGSVEVDETFVGGRESNKHKSKKLNQGRGIVGKTVVLGMVQRNGEIRAGVVPDTRRATLQGVVREHVEKGANLYTDEHSSYRGLNDEYAHHTNHHMSGRYVIDGHNHTNTIESVWALLKRQIIGVHHWISPKHLNRYVGEMTYRLNNRELSVGGIVNDLLRRSEGPLPYKVLIS